MFENNTQVIIDALVAQIKNLKLDVLVRDLEIEHLKAKLLEKTSGEVGADNA